ncbi:hypothetical protein CsatA_010536 [Cannabis sativa]
MDRWASAARKDPIYLTNYVCHMFVVGTLLVHGILALSPEALKLQGHVCYYLRPSFDKKSSLKSSKVNMAGDGQQKGSKTHEYYYANQMLSSHNKKS